MGYYAVTCKFCQRITFVGDCEPVPKECSKCFAEKWAEWDTFDRDAYDKGCLVPYNSTNTIPNTMATPQAETCCDKYRGLFKRCQKCGKEL